MIIRPNSWRRVEGEGWLGGQGRLTSGVELASCLGSTSYSHHFPSLTSLDNFYCHYHLSSKHCECTTIVQAVKWFGPLPPLQTSVNKVNYSSVSVSNYSWCATCVRQLTAASSVARGSLAFLAFSSSFARELSFQTQLARRFV